MRTKLLVVLIGVAFLLGLLLGPTGSQAQPVPRDPMPVQAPTRDCGSSGVQL